MQSRVGEVVCQEDSQGGQEVGGCPSPGHSRSGSGCVLAEIGQLWTLLVDRPVRLETGSEGAPQGHRPMRPVPEGPPGSLLVDGSFPPRG